MASIVLTREARSQWLEGATSPWGRSSSRYGGRSLLKFVESSVCHTTALRSAFVCGVLIGMSRFLSVVVVISLSIRPPTQLVVRRSLPGPLVHDRLLRVQQRRLPYRRGRRLDPIALTCVCATIRARLGDKGVQLGHSDQSASTTMTTTARNIADPTSILAWSINASSITDYLVGVGARVNDRRYLRHQVREHRRHPAAAQVVHGRL